jgi:glycerophosphoryl diester phosphodiesterase
LTDWPYPTWIAHRGAGKLAPENTLAAFQVGASHGYRMFECDVKLSADGVPFLLHDNTLERTTNGNGTAGHQRWARLAALEAGSWHSSAFKTEPIPTLETIAQACLTHGWLLNIEIKPTPGCEAQTGSAVANAAATFWADAEVPPLLSSFQPLALQAAQAAQPQLPRALLLDRMAPDWLKTAEQFGCSAVICQHRLWSADTVAKAKSAGLKTLSYTVNDISDVQRLQALGMDGIITDRVDSFSPRD